MNSSRDGAAIMDEILKPVKSVKKVQNNIEKFESLSLRETGSLRKENQTIAPDPSQQKRLLVEIESNANEGPALKVSRSQPATELITVRESTTVTDLAHKRHDSTVFLQQSYLKSPVPLSLSDNAREILRGQPSHKDLLAVLQYLQFGIEGRHDFNIRVASPKAAQIMNVLVTTTIPDIWINLKQRELSEDEAQIKKLVMSVLTCVAGIGALLAQIKQLSSNQRNATVLSDTILVLGEVLDGNKIITMLLHDVQNFYEKELSRNLYWREVTGLLAGSRVLSTVSQTLSSNISVENLRSHLWLGNGLEYTNWLAKNMAYAATRLNAANDESWNFLSQIVKHGMGLGYRDSFASEIYTKLLLGQRALWTPIHLVLRHLSHHDQKRFFDAILSDIAQKYLASGGGYDITSTQDSTMQKAIAGVAALIAGLLKSNETLEDYAETWLTNDETASKTLGLPMKRALMATFGRSEVKLQRILEKSLTKFGDKLEVHHASILQQEATTQTILLVIGYLNRINIKCLKDPSISSLVTQAVSNHLAASIPKNRLLGMIVGTAVSRLLDKEENVIDFDVEEMRTANTQMLLGLVSICDTIGDMSNLRQPSLVLQQPKSGVKPSKPTPRVTRNNKQIPQSKIVAIEELGDSSGSEDDDLVPYPKPDSDSEDSDEDPTLINRNKPSAPVYIIDVIRQLQTTDKLDVIELALRTAPDLIRRKTSFGTELSDNVSTLVTTLVNLQEGLSEPEMQRLQLDALIACAVAKPELTCPSLADLCFRGDFSISQRMTILTTIGLASREIAGFQDQPSSGPIDNFPSKRLPAHLEPQTQQQTVSVSNPVAMLTDTAAHATIRPMALAAADNMTGPSALKIRTFSSRMEVEKKVQNRTDARTKIVPKNIHKLLTESIYLPLCSRMTMLLSHTVGGQRPNTSILHSSTLRLFLQTLTLVLNTLGPSAGLHLSTLNHETLLLLTNLHNILRLATDAAILPALLHLLLALLDINIEAGAVAQERLITDYGVQVVEMVNWSSSLGGRISVPDAESDEGGLSWTVLAAGIQVKWFEMGKKFQGRMLGLTIDEMDQLAGI